MKGKIVSWNTDKGFGFIASDHHDGRIFVHISSIKKAARQPEVGDAVVFDVGMDAQGRRKATHVVLEGVPLATPQHAKLIVTEPVKKDALDYIAYAILAIALACAVGLFAQTGTPESAVAPAVVSLTLGFWLANRKKKPANKMFSCARCRSVASHDERTVLAWNRGFAKFYCRTCHHQWLREQPKEALENHAAHASSRVSGSVCGSCIASDNRCSRSLLLDGLVSGIGDSSENRTDLF